MNDPFLLSNCCAVLMNLAPLTVDIHEYAAMRLVSVSVSCIKRYFVLRKQNPVGTEEADEALLTSVAQYGEVSRALLHFMKLALSYKKIDQNVQLVYAMVYHQADFQRLFNDNGKFFFLTVVETSNILVSTHQFFYLFCTKKYLPFVNAK